MSEMQPTENLALVRQRLPELQPAALEQLGRLAGLVRDWNERVNLVSRKDVENLEEHHLLHSLAIMRVLRPAPGARLADLGTGGGFPGLPLAVVYPECHFVLIDSVAKKGRAVEDIARSLGLKNVQVITARAEKLSGRFDFVLGRAVAALPVFLTWAAPLLRPGSKSSFENGVLYFKGSRFSEELAETVHTPTHIWELAELYPGLEYFREKFLLHFRAPLPGALLASRG